MDHVERLQEELREITAPLVSHYNELDQTVAQMERDLVKLRNARRQLRTVLRGIDPELVPIESKNGKKPHGKSVSDAKIQAMTTWLQIHAEELNVEGFHASGLEKSRYAHDMPLKSSTLSAALRILHEQGILRLDHTGSGGAKYYKVVI